MKKIGVYLCLLIFVFLAGLKCFKPEATEELRRRVVSVIAIERDYRPVLEELGRQYYQNGMGWELISTLTYNGKDSGA